MKRLELTQGEIDKMIILERIKNNDLTQEEAAKIMKLSSRQVRRKLKRYITAGAEGLVHKNRGKRSNRAIRASIVEEIFHLIKSKYSQLREKAGPTFIAEQLKKNDGISIDHETLRRLMITRGQWVVYNKKKIVHQWRERKHHFGELVQVDGSYHAWFGMEKSTLIAFIDDATGKILWAEFVNRESTENLANSTKDYIKQYGRPLALYSDRGSTYKVNNSKDSINHKTQYQRMLQEVNIELIHARSPQAKGRVERLFKTLQDRLVKELELAKIITHDAANHYLKTIYIPEHNAKFAVEPLEKADFHRPLDTFNLNAIFCIKFDRIINNDYTVCFKDKWFQLDKSQKEFIRRGQKVELHQHFDGTVDIVRNHSRLVFKRITKQKTKTKSLPKEDMRGKNRANYKPPASHPWRHSMTFGKQNEQADISIELPIGHF
jgi:transposase InsO family protein